MSTTTRLDPAVTLAAPDRLLETTTDPLHRQILENYRRHAILEITGDWQGIFDEDSCVEEPVYELNVTGYDGVVARGQDEVKAVYRKLAEDDQTVMILTDEVLMVSDWGFASEAFFNTYIRGQNLIEKGIEVEDPDGYYVMRQKFAMLWPYDERGRMIGEHVYENKAFFEIQQIEERDYLTLADVRARLLPLLRPLPAFAPSVAPSSGLSSR